MLSNASNSLNFIMQSRGYGTNIVGEDAFELFAYCLLGIYCEETSVAVETIGEVPLDGFFFF